MFSLLNFMNVLLTKTTIVPICCSKFSNNQNYAWLLVRIVFVVRYINLHPFPSDTSSIYMHSLIEQKIVHNAFNVKKFVRSGILVSAI